MPGPIPFLPPLGGRPLASLADHHRSSCRPLAGAPVVSGNRPLTAASGAATAPWRAPPRRLPAWRPGAAAAPWRAHPVRPTPNAGHPGAAAAPWRAHAGVPSSRPLTGASGAATAPWHAQPAATYPTPPVPRCGRPAYHLVHLHTVICQINPVLLESIRAGRDYHQGKGDRIRVKVQHHRSSRVN